MAEPRSAAVALQAIEFAHPGAEFALRVPELSIAAGEAIALVGPSGSGKTTLLHLIAGIVVPQRGEVRVGGDVVTAMTESQRRAFRCRGVGLVFQELELLEHLDVTENLVLQCVLRGESAGARGDRLRELAAACGIEGRLRRKPRALSQGERQRVAACRALLGEPAVILADEPTGNLDAANARRLVDLLLTDARARRATLLVVTHDQALLPRFDRTLTMEALCR
ncbi:MAG: ATP-binding cassette domain-containing protein [Planctomycetota bacterium]